jgi:hypothetical protein
MATLDPVLPKKASKLTVANTVARPNRKPQAATGEMRQVVTLL